MTARRLTASLDRLLRPRRPTAPPPPPLSRRAMASHAPRAADAVAIVGGGLAGLSAAARLAQLGIQATVFDMGTRHPGGRACSRERPRDDPQGLAFDHGVQFLAPSGPDFAGEVERWVAGGAAARWPARLGVLDAATLVFTPEGELPAGGDVSRGFCGALGAAAAPSGGALFVGTPSMGSVAQFLAGEVRGAGCSVKTGHKVTALVWSPSQRAWTVEGVPRTPSGGGGGGDAAPSLFGTFAAVVVADALAALPDSAGCVAGLDSPAAPPGVAGAAAAVRGVAHDPALALMVGFEGPVAPGALPWDAATVAAAGANPRGAGGFQWIARDSSKPGRREGKASAECWVGVTSAARAREVLARWPLHAPGGAYNPQTAAYREAVARELLGDFLAVLRGAAPPGTALPRVVYSHAQRWGRAFVAEPLPQAFLGAQEAMFAACGDFCGGGAAAVGAPAEAAWRSGRAAAEAVAGWLR